MFLKVIKIYFLLIFKKELFDPSTFEFIIKNKGKGSAHGFYKRSKEYLEK